MVSWPGTVNTEPEMTVRHWTISDQNTSLFHCHQMQPSKTRTAFGNANFCQPQSTVVLLKRRNASFSCDKRLHFLLRTCLLENNLLILLFWERPIISHVIIHISHMCRLSWNALKFTALFLWGNRTIVLYSIINRTIHECLEIWNYFSCSTGSHLFALLSREISWSTLEINFIFLHIYVMFSTIIICINSHNKQHNLV